MAESESTCNTCGKKETDESPLKRCAKCKTQWYCSRDCQMADWKAHKKTCSKNAGAGSATSTAPKGLTVTIDKPFHALHDKTWLHNRPKEDVHKLLIDTYRMRMEDNYNLEGDADLDCVYGGAPDSRIGFRRFLELTQSGPGLLPQWWSSEDFKECFMLGLSSGWSSLTRAVEKSDIIEHYGNLQMPMQLRLLGEQVYGRGPGGQAGAPMINMMMHTESRGMDSSSFYMASLMSRH